MKSWYRTIREDELKDGSIRKVYHLVFETDDKSIVETIEHFFCDVMDAKTESSSEKPNNCEVEPQWTKENCKGCKYNEYPYDSGTCFVRVCINGNKYEPKDEPTISKMEQVDKDINVRSKDEPQTDGNDYRL